MYFDDVTALFDEIAPSDTQEVGDRRTTIGFETRKRADRITEHGVVKPDLLGLTARGFEALNQGELDPGFYLLELGLGDRFGDDFVELRVERRQNFAAGLSGASGGVHLEK